MKGRRLRGPIRTGQGFPLRRRAWAFSKSPAEAFLPTKSFPTQAEFLALPRGIPTIQVTQIALIKMFVLVGAIDIEVGWLGTAKEEASKVIVIDDVFLFRQTVSAGHSELKADSMNEIMQELLTRPDGEDIFNSMRFWGHSHGIGLPLPSWQDDAQMSLFKQFGANFFVRGIFNRRGDVNFSVYDWRRQIAFHHAPWQIVGKPLAPEVALEIRETLRDEMRQKVVHAVPVYVPPAPVPVVHGTAVGGTTIVPGQNDWGAWEYLRYLWNHRKEV